MILRWLLPKGSHQGLMETHLHASRPDSLHLPLPPHRFPIAFLPPWSLALSQKKPPICTSFSVSHNTVTGQEAVFSQNGVLEAMKNEASRQEYGAISKVFNEVRKGKNKSLPLNGGRSKSGGP